MNPARWYPATLVAAALTCALAPAYVIRWHVSIVPTTLLEVAILATIAVFLVETYRGPRRIQWRTAFTYAALLFLIAGAISILAAPDRRAALGLYRAYLIEPIAFFFVLGTVVRSAQRALVIFLGLAVGAIALSVPNAIVVLQAIAHHTLHVQSTTPVVIYTTANAVALYLEPLIALAGSLLLFSRDRNLRIVSLVTLAIIVPTEILTLSRGGFLALAAVVVGLALAHRRRWWFLAVVVVAGVVVSRVPSVAARIAVEVDFNNPGNTLVGRSQLWKAALQMLRDHPIFGAGLSGFTTRLAPYWNLHHHDRFIDPHNIVLNFWSETGLLGLAAFSWILVVAFVVSWRGWRRTDASGWQPFQLGVFLALVAVVVHGLVDVPYFKNDLSLEFWTLLAIAWAGTYWSPKRSEPAPAATPTTDVASGDPRAFSGSAGSSSEAADGPVQAALTLAPS
jgi:putative inorganic carbon (HCO3(-)) transporter